MVMWGIIDLTETEVDAFDPLKRGNAAKAKAFSFFIASILLSRMFKHRRVRPTRGILHLYEESLNYNYETTG